MAEFINPRLLARVERSLRKRVGSDVKPHLLRCAAHARSEDEFMASAARLLINLQERNEWLASWVTRRHRESEDTTPLDIDLTQPVAIDPFEQRSFRLTPGQRNRLRYALARELGPAAKELVDNELQEADSVSDLLGRLQSHLDTDEQRHRFRQAATSSSKAQADR